jgi:hypothetical protein
MDGCTDELYSERITLDSGCITDNIVAEQRQHLLLSYFKVRINSIS